MYRNQLMRRHELATHRQLVRVTHDVLDTWTGPRSDLEQAVKERLISLGMSWGRYSRCLYAAIESAIFQRQLRLDGQKPKYKHPDKFGKVRTARNTKNRELQRIVEANVRAINRNDAW